MLSKLLLLVDGLVFVVPKLCCLACPLLHGIPLPGLPGLPGPPVPNPPPMGEPGDPGEPGAEEEEAKAPSAKTSVVEKGPAEE